MPEARSKATRLWLANQKHPAKEMCKWRQEDACVEISPPHLGLDSMGSSRAMPTSHGSVLLGASIVGSEAVTTLLMAICL